jgi:hypothetical protein
MKKHICTWALIPGLLLALPTTKTRGENVIVGMMTAVWTPKPLT